jgi:hypothetical protein
MGESSDVAQGGVGLRCFGRLASVILIALCLLALASLFGGAEPAGAQNTSGVTFQSGAPLSLSMARLVHGMQVKVCNGSARRISRFSVIPTDFRFTRNGRAAAPASVVAVRRLRGAIPAGACAAVSIHIRSPKTIDAGEYTGTLLLVGAGGGSARLTMTVMNVKETAAKPDAATEPATLSITSPSPVSGGGDTMLLLKSATEGESKLAIGEGCDPAAPTEQACPFIGNLYRGSQIVRVRVIGQSKPNLASGVQEVPVRLHSSDHPVGDFAGTVTLPGSSPPIKVKLTAKDAWWCAVIALLVGVLVTLAIQLWNGRWQPKDALLERARALPARYGDSSGAGEPTITVSKKGLRAYRKAVQRSIEQYASSVVEFDTTSAAYKAIDASLKLAEEDAVVLTSKSGLARAIGTLEREAIATTNSLHAKEVMDVPEILRLAAEMRKRVPLQVGEATKRANQADELLPTLVEWHKLASRLLANVVWMQALASNARLATRRSTLTRIGVDLWTSRQRLFEATRPSEIAAVGSSKTLARAFERIAYLAAETGLQYGSKSGGPRLRRLAERRRDHGQRRLRRSRGGDRESGYTCEAATA